MKSEVRHSKMCGKEGRIIERERERCTNKETVMERVTARGRYKHSESRDEIEIDRDTRQEIEENVNNKRENYINKDKSRDERKKEIVCKDTEREREKRRHRRKREGQILQEKD